MAKVTNKSNIISDSRVVEVYKKMLFVRRFEEACAKLYLSKFISGFCHLYIGQEAVVAGIYEAITKDDSVITSYRDHAQILFSGTDPKLVMAELLGKSNGVSRGKGGSMHLFDTSRNFYGGHGIVGAQVPIGTGIAFANKYKGNNSVCVTFFGDGACHQGQVYESFNMAKLWNLPVIYILENNEYAMGTSVLRSSSLQDLYKKGESFGIPGVRVNGMDIFEVKTAMDQALSTVRSGSGPILLEIKTYRYRGHSMSDPAKYRTKEEVEGYKNKDPIESLKSYILSKSIANEIWIDEVNEATNIEIDKIVEFAKNSPVPDLEDLYKNVYC